MASFTLERPQVFPEGTVVKAYAASNWPDPSAAAGAPKGASTAEGTVAEGKVTFGGLAEEVAYFAVAEVGGTYRYVAVRIGKPGGNPTRSEVEAMIAAGGGGAKAVEELKAEIAPIDTDGAAAANSDTRVMSQKATKTLITSTALPQIPGIVFPALNPMGYIGNGFVPLEKVPILARFIVPKTGVLKSLSCFPKTSAGNVAMGIYDTGDAAAGKRTRLYESGSVAVGTASKWQVVAAAPNLNVKAGQQLDVMAVFDSNTIELGRWAMLSGNEAVLPEGWNVVPGGASPKMNGTITAIASIAALPETINEASITTTANLPAFAFRIE